MPPPIRSRLDDISSDTNCYPVKVILSKAALCCLVDTGFDLCNDHIREKYYLIDNQESTHLLCW
uniref:Uncharacterized protein n=1 Tax=Oryza glumipatula TaxID=40148 RepID=A0A0E0BRB2_9ORYZ